MKLFVATAALSVMPVYMSAQIAGIENPVGAVFARQGGETPAGTFRLTSGGYEVYTIATSDKPEVYQSAKLFYGDNEADKAKVDALAPEGKVASAMNCFFVRTAAGYIMFDTGLPASRGGMTLSRMASLNVNPEDVGAVFLTHGHFDHIGGLLGADGKAAYPQAVIYMSSPELEFIKTSMAEAYANISAAYEGRIAAFEPGEILPYGVLPISAKGHTPGHTVYRLGNLLFVGDIMHGASVQLREPSVNAGYDADREAAAATRMRVLSYAVENSLTVLGSHIPGNGVIF